MIICEHDSEDETLNKALLMGPVLLRNFLSQRM